MFILSFSNTFFKSNVETVKTVKKGTLNARFPRVDVKQVIPQIDDLFVYLFMFIKGIGDGVSCILYNV